MDAQDKLGDPSGQSGTEYWDTWFQTVSAGNSFEWYTKPTEIIRVLKHVMMSMKSSTSSNNPVNNNGNLSISALHAGSGNSMLPMDMTKCFRGSRQVILDCSSVAIEEMKMRQRQRHDDDDDDLIEYVLGDVLSDDALPFESESFHAWIDKGLLDAIFSDCGDFETQTRQCQQMLDEANRLLHTENGVCLIVSLAQSHSLELLWSSLDLNFNQSKLSSTCKWSAPIEIFEVAPTSNASSLRPFAFVIRKNNNENETSATGLCTDTSTSIAALFHYEDGRCEKVLFNRSSDTVLDDITKLLNSSRASFASMVQENQKSSANRLSLVTLDIKPFDIETDLAVLSSIIQNKCSQAFSSFKHQTSTLVPIGFGLNKIQFHFIIGSEDIEEVCDYIIEEEADAVQSVDVDWENTFQCGDTTSLLKTQILK